jgi:hypothetical protein
MDSPTATDTMIVAERGRRNALAATKTTTGTAE